MAISRYFSDENLYRIKNDFKFLVAIVKNSYGEYDFAIRDNYFNLYYKGYSIGKIEPKHPDIYLVTIHKKFFENTTVSLKFSKSHLLKDYNNLILNAKELHPFFQVKHLAEFAANVSDIPSGEIGFEQAIITDNIGNENLIIIDRQITSSELKRKRLDLLALKKIEGNKYHFLILEIKLGNNKELNGQVAKQLEEYINHINGHFNEYKICYEKQFAQKHELGLIEKPDSIEIIHPAQGKIVVGGYSGIASDVISKLLQAHPDLDIKHFKYEL